MTQSQAKAEADKIIHLYRNHVAIDYQYDEEPLLSCQIECAIIHVKGIINFMNSCPMLNKGKDTHTIWAHWQSILTQLEKK